MFLTWQLWRALRYPTRQHPLFQRARTMQIPSMLRILWYGLLVLLLLSLVIIGILSPGSLVLFLLGTLVGLPLLLIVFHATILGMTWVATISTIIEDIHRENNYDLLQLTPSGALGMIWQLATGIMHRHNWLLTIHRVLRWVLSLSFALILLGSLTFAAGMFASDSSIARQAQVNVLGDVFYLSMVLILIWLDFIQSNLIAMLVGTIAPGSMKHALESRVVLPIVFLTLQVITYAATALIFRLSGVFTGALEIPQLMSSGFIAGFTGFAFFSIREMQISILVRLMLARYDATILDLQRIIHQPE